MPVSEITISDVHRFIHEKADRDAIDGIHLACKNRLRTLSDISAAAVQVGMRVRAAGISPKYLVGLTGTVESLDGTYAKVRLDEASTNRLRYTRQQRFPVAPGVSEYLLEGVPRSCLTQIDLTDGQ